MNENLGAREKIQSGVHHSFDTGIAYEFKSIELATLIHHFQFWIRHNKTLRRNQIDGRTWTYQTFNEIVAHFPYWSIDQAKRLMKKLVELDVLIKDNHSSNTHDRTSWYAFKDEEKYGISTVKEREELIEEDKIAQCIVRNRTMDKAESHHRASEIALCNKDTDNNTYNNKDNTPPNPRGEAANAACASSLISSLTSKIKSSANEAKCYGKSIKLTDYDYESLCAKYGKAEIDSIIEEMNDYCAASKPKGYKDWAAAIRQWMRKRISQTPNHSKVVKIDNTDLIYTRKEQITQHRKANWEKIKYLQVFYEIYPEYVQIGNDKIYYKDFKFNELVQHALRKVDLK